MHGHQLYYCVQLYFHELYCNNCIATKKPNNFNCMANRLFCDNCIASIMLYFYNCMAITCCTATIVCLTIV